MTNSAKNAAQAQQPSRDMMHQGYDFRGATVFVSGGTSGINFGIAQAFARPGAKLTVASRKPANGSRRPSPNSAATAAR